MNVIIPLGGKGERFKNDSYDCPKVLIPLFGKPMLLHVINGLNLTPADTLLIVYSGELDTWGLSDLVHQYGARLHRLEQQTQGAAETVQLGLATLPAELLSRPTMLVDGDTIYHTDPVSRFRECTTNAVFCFEDNSSRPIYSYVKTDDAGMVKQIKEKEKIGRLACTGAYCFKSGSELFETCKRVIDDDLRVKGEFYTSCVVSAMIESGAPFTALEIQKRDFSCVGTPLELRNFCGNLHNFKEPRRFCFDLDSTLVTQPMIAGDYSTVKPIDHNIATLRFLKKIGNYIIINTARRMKTHRGNVGKVVRDVGRVTMDTLELFNIPYDELLFGKPYADFYIDDKAVSAYSDLERAIGFYTTAVSERDFNEIKEDRIEVIVKSSRSDKIQGEIHWYRNVPQPVRHLFPAMLRSVGNSYTLEKIQGTTLSHLYVAGSMNPDIFTRYLEALSNIHDSSPVTDKDLDYYANYSAKLEERYKSYDYSKFAGSDKLYEKILAKLITYEENKGALPGVIHGDPVFSNCIVNPQGMYFIDMRGMLGNRATIFGDRLYDYAKVYQSLAGYDEILLDRRVPATYRASLRTLLTTHIREKYGEESLNMVRVIAASLFFSLIPLHDNAKCESYYALAERTLSTVPY